MEAREKADAAHRRFVVHDQDNVCDKAVLDDIARTESWLTFGPDSEIEARNLGFTSTRSGTSISGRANLNWQVTPNDFVQVNGFLNGRRLTAQGSIEPQGMLNIGYRHKFNDRWSLLILRDAFRGVRRFDDLQRDLGIARNILSNRLGKLVEHGILARQAIANGLVEVQRAPGDVIAPAADRDAVLVPVPHGAGCIPLAVAWVHLVLPPPLQDSLCFPEFGQLGLQPRDDSQLLIRVCPGRQQVIKGQADGSDGPAGKPCSLGQARQR